MPSATIYALQQACGQPGCPACRVERAALERYLSSLFYESVNDIDLRARLRDSLGFCRDHARLVLDSRVGNALGSAILYHDIANHVLRQLRDEAVVPIPRRWTSLVRQLPEQASQLIRRVLHALTPQRACVVCEEADQTRHLVMASILDGLQLPEWEQALRASDGFCLPHLKRAFEVISQAELCETLLAIHAQKLEQLRDELAEFIRKNDYRFHQESMGAEGDAWQRALRRIVGDW